MRRSTLSKPMLSVCVPFGLVLLVVLASTLVATSTLTLAQEAKVQRVIFGSAGFTERLSGNKAFITEHFRSYAGQG